MSSSKPIQAIVKTDQERLRDLSNLPPDDFLSRIAEELQGRLKCETVCILLWYEVLNNRPRDAGKNNGYARAGALVTRYQAGLPERLLGPSKKDPKKDTKTETDADPNSPRDYSEIYFFGQGITGGYIFKDRKNIRAKIAWEPRLIFDEASQEAISVADINWSNMERFRRESKYKDFKSLLGLPLLVKGQQIGVLKLINKLASDSDTLAEDGFTNDDLEKVKNFLSTIELVIETKMNEKQTKSLLKITEQITSADFNFGNLLQETATSCAKALNLKACIIRLLDHRSLTVRGSSVGDDETAAFEDFGIAAQVMESKRGIKLAGKSFQTIDASVETYAVAVPDVWANEFYGTKSFLAVPVIYQNRAIGVIECYAFLQHEFSDQQIAAIEGYGTLISTLFQRNRVTGIISSLIESFSLLSSEEQVHQRVLELIQEYLDTKTVSIWEKKPKQAKFDFELITASDGLRQKYEAKSIRNLTDNSITARVANATEARIKHFPQSELEKEGAEYADFLKENNLRSLTVVPITICGHVNAVIDVFYEDDRRLFLEDEDFLRVLAGRAAAAVWTKKLALSFKAIADEVLASRTVDTILQKIAFTARSVLFADLVLLFPYNPLRREFGPHQMSGKPFHEIGIYKGEKKEKDFVNLMLEEPDPIYLHSTEEYVKFCKEKRTRPARRRDFWHREKLCSMAAVRLVDARKAPLGVMFFNYRRPFIFDYSTKHVIHSFASQTASALVSGNFRVTRTGEQMAELELVGLLNNLAVIMDVVGDPLARLMEQTLSSEEKIRKQALDQLTDYSVALRRLNEDIDEKRTYFARESDWRHHHLNDLVENVLALLDNRFKELRIQPDTKYAKLPSIFCDSSQIRNLIYQLLSILLDATPAEAPTLKISTKSYEHGNRLSVHMVLGGGRVSDDQLQAVINQPLFPSQGGTGTGPGRFQMFKLLAQSMRAKVTINPREDGLVGELDIFQDD